MSAADQLSFLDELPHHILWALPHIFEFWALPHQLPPEGLWRVWVLLGGRGAGKTRAGAEWVRMQVEGAGPLDPGRSSHVALVGETYDQARDVMVLGESGILACSPPDRRPRWQASLRRLVWPNGAVAQVYSASDPEALRGPQFDAAWLDELAKWRKGKKAWDMLQLATRIGDDPRICVTTTPRNTALLKDILALDTTVTTHAATEVNRANLAQSFLNEMRSRYDGTSLGRQELDGVLVDDLDGALWPQHILESARRQFVEDASFDRIVVAVDPCVTARQQSDACGIVVVGCKTQGDVHDWTACVLEDATVTAASPLAWARAAIAAFHRHNADRIVAEVNQGGDLVETVLRQVDPLIPFFPLHAHKGKTARAEPIAALYEQNRVSHAPGLDALEAQMGTMARSGWKGTNSPDRLDALVWALHEALLVPAHQTLPSLRDL